MKRPIINITPTERRPQSDRPRRCHPEARRTPKTLVKSTVTGVLDLTENAVVTLDCS